MDVISNAYHAGGLAYLQFSNKPDGTFEVLERIEGGRHMISTCQGPPAVFGWATGNLPEPRNNPQVGMTNMRVIMPALQKAKSTALPGGSVRYLGVTPPKQQRQTRIVKDRSAEEIAGELCEWIAQE